MEASKNEGKYRMDGNLDGDNVVTNVVLVILHSYAVMLVQGEGVP